MSEYALNALRAELESTQASLYNLQGVIEQLTHAIAQLPSEIASAIAQGIAEARPPVPSPADISLIEGK